MDPKDKPEATSETPVSGTPETAQAKPDMVEIHDASVEDLDAAIAEAQANESASTSDDVQAEKETVNTGEGAEASTPENTNGQSVQGANAQSTGVATTGAEASKPRTYTQDEIQAILAENERHKKEGNQKELFIQHRGTELGQLRMQLAENRRQLAELKAQLSNGLEDRFSENPVQASNDRDKIKEIDQHIEALNNQEERASRIVEAQTFFLRHVDTEKVSVDDITEMLKADGIPEQYVQHFKANPWEFTTPEALVQMGKRAMDRKEFITADNDRRLLAKHVLYLNGELEKAKRRPGQVVNQLQRSLNQAPGVTAASNASPKAAGNVDPSRMSIAELDAALKNAMAN